MTSKFPIYSGPTRDIDPSHLPEVRALVGHTEDLTGKKFGDRYVVGYVGHRRSGSLHAHYLVRCERPDCGRYDVARGNNLSRGVGLTCMRCAQTSHLHDGEVERLPRKPERPEGASVAMLEKRLEIARLELELMECRGRAA